MTLVAFVIMNLPPELRFKKKNFVITTIIPGPKKPFNIHSFLFPTYQDLIKLEKNGMLVYFNDEKKSPFTASLGLVIGDIPACANLCGHVGHQAYYGCRICKVKATRYKGTMCYLPTHLGNLEELMIENEDFKEGDKERGITEKSPFALLNSFHGPFFWGLDEMHFWGANIGGKLWSIITDNDQKFQGTRNPLFLRVKYRELIAEKMLLAQQNKHNSSSNEAFLDVYRKSGRFRSIDWVDFIMFILPTLVVDALQLQKQM